MTENFYKMLDDVREADKTRRFHDILPDLQCNNTEHEKICADAVDIGLRIGCVPRTLTMKVMDMHGISECGCCAEHEISSEDRMLPQRVKRFADDKEKIVIGKKYICDSNASKAGACKACVKNANRIFKWPEEADKMPKLPLHPNCKCRYEDIYAKTKKDASWRKLLIDLCNSYYSGKNKIRIMITAWADELVKNLQEMASADSYLSFDKFRKAAKSTIKKITPIVSACAGIILTVRQMLRVMLVFFRAMESNKTVKEVIDALVAFDIDITDKYETLRNIHYARLEIELQKIQYLPKNPKEARSELAQNYGWVRAKDSENWYHRNKGGKSNVKYYNKQTGQEVVYESDSDDAKIVSSVDNIGTYNHHAPGDFRSNMLHMLYDVLPYWLWGNAENDDTPIENRLLGNTE